MEDLGDGAADHDLTEGEGGEYLVEGVLREAVDRRRLHFRSPWDRVQRIGFCPLLFCSVTERGEREREI